MKDIKTICAALLFSSVVAAYGQDRKFVGKVISSTNVPVSGAVISFPGMGNVTTDDKGMFEVELKEDVKSMSVWAPGYYTIEHQLINGRSDALIMMIPESKYKYNESSVLPQRIESAKIEGTAASNINKKDFTLGTVQVDRALSGQVAGLQVTRSSGMPGEGSYLNLRGVRSLVADNQPLIVINGVPYMPDKNESQLINGFSRNLFQAYNINDIVNITVLKGADAAMYGSLGSNGVILIETEQAISENLDTEISFYGQYGISWNNERMSLLKGTNYKSYLSDIGMSYFGNMEEMFAELPFLSSSNSIYSYLYNNATDWQDLIYQNAFVTDNLFRVKGGDAIAKYDFSLGYTSEMGVLKNTSFDSYHTLLNTNVLISSKVEMAATISMAYMEGSYHNQGMESETNPILAAYAHSPYLAPYAMDEQGKVMNGVYSSYYYGISEDMNLASTNPLAAVNTIEAGSHQYDLNMRVALTYRPLMGLSFSGTFGLYYNYNKESLFIPGVDDQAIMPVYDQYGILNNTVKEGIATAYNLFFNVNGQYTKTFNDVHKLNTIAGFQLITTDNEYDAGTGRNTANDFYKTLDSVDDLGRYFYGYTENWNWMNFYAHADYTYMNMWKVSANMSVDGSSASGVDAARFYVYPSVGLAWMGKNLKTLSDLTWLNRLDVRAEYSMTGNSRFSSKYGKFYYSSMPYDAVSGIVRVNVPNTELKPERNSQIDLGLDLSVLNDRVNLSFDYYWSKTTDGVILRSLSPVYGTGNYYDNMAEITNRGLELSVAASVVRTRDFEWIIGGNIAKNVGKITSLSGNDDIITDLGDGAQWLNGVGYSPYQFYGLQAVGVYSTEEEATAAGLVNASGVAYQAGDVIYVDQNGDGRIDDNDRVALGSASPDFFGGFFTKIRYKNIALSAEFSYSKGNLAYNAVRRSLESLSSANNQSMAVVNRWNLEGQQTDIPRAVWGDPAGNNDFSSRWIEDASYLRLKNVTLSYDFNKPIWNFFRSGTIYITGENLLTFTEYLGLDPEFSYSSTSAEMQGLDYAKLTQPRTVKFGINLKF